MKYIIVILIIPLIVTLFVFWCISLKMVLKPEENFVVFLTNTQPLTSPIQEDNQPSDFYTVLPEKIILENNWEVALLELSFRKDWKNIPDDEPIQMTCDQNMDFPALMSLEPNNFNNIEDLIGELNGIIESNKDSYNFTILPQFSIDPSSNRVQIKSGKCNPEKSIRFPNTVEHTCLPILSENLNRILGFTNDDGTTFSYFNNENISNFEDSMSIFDMLSDQVGIKFILAQREYNLHIIQYMDIHTNIVKPSINGNREETILAKLSVPQNKSNKEWIVIPVEYPVYQEISHPEITEILIQIFDDNGRLINFEKENKISAVLEFRKRNAFRKSILKLLRQSSW